MFMASSGVTQGNVHGVLWGSVWLYLDLNFLFLIWEDISMLWDIWSICSSWQRCVTILVAMAKLSAAPASEQNDTAVKRTEALRERESHQSVAHRQIAICHIHNTRHGPVMVRGKSRPIYTPLQKNWKTKIILLQNTSNTKDLCKTLQYHYSIYMWACQHNKRVILMSSFAVRLIFCIDLKPVFRPFRVIIVNN